MSSYTVRVDKKEEITISVLPCDDGEPVINVAIKGGPNMSKEHGRTHLSEEGLDNLIATLKAVREEVKKL